MHEHSDVTIVGTISGKAHIGMGGGSSIGPVVETEKLYRWSDCLSGGTGPFAKQAFWTPNHLPAIERVRGRYFGAFAIGLPRNTVAAGAGTQPPAKPPRSVDQGCCPTRSL